MRSAEDIRAEAIMVAAKEIASWESDPNPNSRHMSCGEGVVDTLAAAGLLPVDVREELTGGFQIGIHKLGDPYPPVVKLRQYVTDWREVAE